MKWIENSVNIHNFKHFARQSSYVCFFCILFCFSSSWLVLEAQSIALLPSKHSLLLHFQNRTSSQSYNTLSCIRTKLNLKGGKICILILCFYTMHIIYTSLDKWEKKKKKGNYIVVFTDKTQQNAGYFKNSQCAIKACQEQVIERQV